MSRVPIHTKPISIEMPDTVQNTWNIQSMDPRGLFIAKYKPMNNYNRKCQDYVYIKWEYWSTM